MSYELAVSVCGRGEDPNHRSHWGFLLSAPGSQYGNLLQVVPLDLERLIYQFERRDGESLESRSCEGRYIVANLSAPKYQEAESIITREPAPRNGKVCLCLAAAGKCG